MATPTGIPVFTAPIPGVKTKYVVRQEFMQRADSFNPQALNTRYKDSFADADDFEICFTTQGLAGNNFFLVEETEPTRIGIMYVWTRVFAMIPQQHAQPSNYNYNFIGFLVTGINRERFQQVVPAKIVFDYFLIEDSDDILAIPTNVAQIYFIKTDTTGENKSYLAQKLTGAGTFSETSPTYEEYQNWIATSRAIVAEDSSIQRWMGNIIERQTIMILPK